MLHVNLQLDTELDYDGNVLHGYVDKNFLRLNICRETNVTVMFNAIAQGEGEVFFLNDPGGSRKTFIYSMLLASVRQGRHVTIKVASSGITTFLL
jgi:hypothetical protein